MLSEEEEEGVCLAERVLVEQHRMGPFSDFAFTIIIIRLVVLHLLSLDNLLVLQVNVEQDLTLVLLQ